MPTRDEYLKQPVEKRLERMERTADDLAAAIQGQGDAALSRRTDAKNWSAKEAVCHLRDTEELFMVRFRTILAMDDPKFLVLGQMPKDPAKWGYSEGDRPTVDPERWAEERQYLRNDTTEALDAFRKRREETLAFFRKLTPEQRRRASTHVTLGSVALGDWTALIAGHDDTHLNQLKQALEG